MRRLTKIVVGYDFHPGGETALRAAIVLAARCGAQLKLIHVVEPYPVYQQLSHPLTPPYTTEELGQKAGERLQHLVTATEPGLTRVGKNKTIHRANRPLPFCATSSVLDMRKFLSSVA